MLDLSTINGAGVASVGQAIRFGLFDKNLANTGTYTARQTWLGYLGTTDSSAANSVFEKNGGGTKGDYLLTTGDGAFVVPNAGGTYTYAPTTGTFSFSETISKTATGVDVSFSMTNGAMTNPWVWSTTYSDATPNYGASTVQYNRVGIGFSGAYFPAGNVATVSFSNIAVAVPEPASIGLLGLGVLGAASRRRRA